MTKRNRAILFAIAGGGAALIGAAVLLLLTRQFRVGLAGLSPAEAAAYSAALKDVPGARSAVIAKLDAVPSPRSLPDAIIAPMGAALSALSDEFASIPDATIRKTPYSIAAAARDAKDRPYAMPLQLDQFQVAYSFSAFERLGIKIEKRLTLAQLEGALAAYKASGAPALLFAGEDDESLLLVISALCLSLGGEDAYRDLVKELAGGAEFRTLAEARLGRGQGGKSLTLGSLIGELRSWGAKGYLHPEWFNLKPIDVAAYLRNGSAFVALIPLSQRRTVPYESINRYGWDGYPAAQGVQSRAYLAPMTALAFNSRASGRGPQAVMRGISDFLTNGDAALALAKSDGRATTLAAAPSPDIQATKAMNWAAESGIVVNGVYRDAFVSSGAAHAFAEELRNAAR
jgi:hypothetical protein